MQHDNLVNHYRTNLALHKYHGFSLTEMEGMMPWERLVYHDMISTIVRDEQVRAHDERNLQKDIQSLAGKQKLR